MADREGPPPPAALAARRPSALAELRRSVRSRLRHLPSHALSSHQHNHGRKASAGGEGDDAADGYDIQAELVSRDRARQKEAVRRYLQARVRNDWVFDWPPPPPSPAAATSVPVVGEALVAATATASATTNAIIPNSPPTVEGTVVAGNSPAAAAAAAVDNIGNGQDVAGETVTSEQQLQTPLTFEADDDDDVTPQLSAAGGADAAKADEPIDSGAEADSDTESIYSVMSDDPSQYRPRAEWISDISDDDEGGTAIPSAGPTVSPSPFRFDSPDSVGVTVQVTTQAGREKRRRANRDEITWNEGLACFSARRDAWTGARTVHLKPRPPVRPTSPASPRRRDKLFRFRSNQSHGEGDAVVLASPSSTTTNTPSSTTAAKVQTTATTPAITTTGIEAITPPTSDGDSQHNPSSLISPTTSTRTPGPTAASAADLSSYPIETILPVPPPLLPPDNPMRASITPALYLSIYDKVVASAAQPSCPINLADMIRSCVAAWRRDGEWPPRPAMNNMMAYVQHDAPPMMVGMGGMGAASGAAAARARRRVDKEKEQQRRQELARREGSGGGGGGGHGRRLSLAGLMGRRNSAAGVDGSGGSGTGGTGAGATLSSPTGDDERKGIRKSFKKILHIGNYGPTPAAAAIETAAPKS